MSRGQGGGPRAGSLGLSEASLGPYRKRPPGEGGQAQR